MNLRKILENLRPMPVVSGVPIGPRDGHQGQTVLEEDADLLERTKHVRQPKEIMLEFFARTGLGASQIRAMSKDEIARFCKIAAESARETEHVDVKFYAPKMVPPRFVLTD